MVLQNIKNNKESGFTIVELLIVIVIIGILAAITIVSYTGITNRANTTKAQSNAASLQSVAEVFFTEQNRYPTTTTEFSTTEAAKMPAGVTVIPGLPGAAGAFTGTDPLIAVGAATKATTVTWACTTASCANATGGRITYWDFSTGAQSTSVVYVGDGSATKTFYAPAS